VAESGSQWAAEGARAQRALISVLPVLTSPDIGVTDNLMNSKTNPDAFDKSLTVGMKVIARWTNSGYSYAVPATIAKVNGKSVIVTLDEEVRGPSLLRSDVETVIYPIGRRITLPRLWGQCWSANNCAASVAA
jgi:hypothetical protein